MSHTWLTAIVNNILLRNFIVITNFYEGILRVWMVVEDRFETNSKIKKKIVGNIENYDYYCMWHCTVVGGEKERVTEN